jgi:hypothetical protein
MRLRHRQTVIIDTDDRHPQPPARGVSPFSPLRAVTNFNLEINLPCGGNDPDQVGVNMTVTGYSSISNNITFQVWYSDSNGNNTYVMTPVLPLPAVPGENYYSWSVTFLAPGIPGTPSDYTFSIQGTYQPPGAPGFTTVLISAPFETQ